MNENETKTIVTEQTQAIVNDNLLSRIEAPVFILFAEYLGFRSKLLDWSERACNGEKIPFTVMKFIEVEALQLSKTVVARHGKEKVVKFYLDFYPLILEEYEKNYKKGSINLIV